MGEVGFSQIMRMMVPLVLDRSEAGVIVEKVQRRHRRQRAKKEADAETHGAISNEGQQRTVIAVDKQVSEEGKAEEHREPR